MEEFTFTFWTKAGPRDQRNCLNGWGKRTLTVKGNNYANALFNLIQLIGYQNYGGTIQ